MKKIVVILFAAIICFVGCSSENTDDKIVSETTNAFEETQASNDIATDGDMQSNSDLPNTDTTIIPETTKNAEEILNNELNEFCAMVEGFWVNMEDVHITSDLVIFNYYAFENGEFSSGAYPGCNDRVSQIVGVENNGTVYTIELYYPPIEMYGEYLEEEYEKIEIELSDDKLSFVGYDGVYTRKGFTFDEAIASIKSSEEKSIEFEFVVNEWDSNFNITQLKEKAQFCDAETEIFDKCNNYLLEKPTIPFPMEKVNISCDYNRNSSSFVISFTVQNLGSNIDEFIISDYYRNLVSYGLRWLDYIENPIITDKEMIISYITPKVSGNEYFEGVAFNLVDDMVYYTSNYKIESESLISFIKNFNIDYEISSSNSSYQLPADLSAARKLLESYMEAIGSVGYSLGYQGEEYDPFDDEFLYQYIDTIHGIQYKICVKKSLVYRFDNGFKRIVFDGVSTYNYFSDRNEAIRFAQQLLDAYFAYAGIYGGNVGYTTSKYNQDIRQDVYSFIDYNTFEQYAVCPATEVVYSGSPNNMQVVFSKGECIDTECESDTPEDKSVVGRWWDTDSMRCNMTIEQVSDTVYDVEVNWSSSAWENTRWLMRVYYDATTNTYSYSNGVQQHIICDENGNETVDVVYDNGSGKIYIENEYLFWIDNIEAVRNGCPFRK